MTDSNKNLVTIQWLDEEQLETYQQLLPRGLEDQLKHLRSPTFFRHTGVFVLGCSLFNLPVGACLIQIQLINRKQIAEIISIAVGKIFQGKGFGSLLMRELIQRLKRFHIEQLEISIPSSSEHYQQLSELTNSTKGWIEKGSTTLYSIPTRLNPEFQAKFTSINARHSKHYKISFVALPNNNQKLKLLNRKLQAPGWAELPIDNAGKGYTPWGTFERNLSCLLKVNNDVMGWCICHRISSYSHRITVAYVDSSLQKKGLMMLVICEAVQRIYQFAVDNSLLHQHTTKFGVLSTNPKMLRVAERHLESLSSGSILTTKKILFI